MSIKNYPAKRILGIMIAPIPLSKIASVITHEFGIDNPISSRQTRSQRVKKKTFFYVNAHCLILAAKDSEYKKILQSSTLVYSGGIGPVLASRILGHPLPGRTPTPDFIDQVFAFAQDKKWSFYFLGSEARSVKKAAEKLKKKFPKLVIAGYHHGYFDRLEEKRIISDINKKLPTVLLVGMGSSKQEKWIWENKDRLDARVFWSVGNLFDVISGKMSRGPVFLQRMGFEWLFRLYQEPRRLWRRYTLGNVYFVYLVIKDLIKSFNK